MAGFLVSAGLDFLRIDRPDLVGIVIIVVDVLLTLHLRAAGARQQLEHHETEDEQKVEVCGNDEWLIVLQSGWCKSAEDDGMCG